METLDTTNLVIIKRGTVKIRRTSWKDKKAYDIISGDVSSERLQKCIDEFERLGFVEVEFWFDNTEKMYVNDLGRRLHCDY
jgi:phosphoribosylaminoimidazole carboxylase (NCAIR synthetase)